MTRDAYKKGGRALRDLPPPVFDQSARWDEEAIRYAMCGEPAPWHVRFDEELERRDRQREHGDDPLLRITSDFWILERRAA